MGIRKTEMGGVCSWEPWSFGEVRAPTLKKEMGLTCPEVESLVSWAFSSPITVAWDSQLPEPVGPCL